MKPTVTKLLNALPPYRDQWLVITDNQSVEDIIEEVLAAHAEFAPQYDKISSFFCSGSDRDVCENLYAFLESNIRYKEETEDDQTTATPAGILSRGHCDCKGYAGFIGGILDACNRNGRNINWCYRFASYRPFDKTPHHVFIVVKNGFEETFIDPTPMAEGAQPYWYGDRKISIKKSTIDNNMGLSRNIAGIVTDNSLAQGSDGYESFEIPAGADLYYDVTAGEWKVILPHFLAGVRMGQTDPVSTGLSIIASITSLFGKGGSGSAAAQKIFTMFPLPAVPTVQNMTDLLNAIVIHENMDAGLDSQWISAFADIKRQYTNLLSALQTGQAAPAIVVPAAGQPAFTTLPPSVHPSVPGASNLLPGVTAPGGIAANLSGYLLPIGIVIAAIFLFKKKRA